MGKSEVFGKPKFTIFRKPRFCPNAAGAGFSGVDASVGDLIVYEEDYTDGTTGKRLARVLGLVNEFDNGKLPEGEHLVVLAADDTLSFGYERYIPLDKVLAVTKAGDFARFFLFGEAPLPEVAIAASRYGAMNFRIGKYLQDGELRASFRDVDKVREDDEAPGATG